MLGPNDYPAEEDAPYIERIWNPLAQGYGVACFYAYADGEAFVVAAAHNPGKGEAIDPDWATRVRSMVANQMEARVIAAEQGFEAVCP